jgi:hypothetical protein
MNECEKCIQDTLLLFCRKILLGCGRKGEYVQLVKPAGRGNPFLPDGV